MNRDGCMTCDSDVGRGTTFEIYLPAIDETKTNVGDIMNREMPQKGRETILVVDDEKMIRDFAEEALQEFDYSVMTASNGEEALKMYTDNHASIDLVVMDIGMPNMGGHKCLSEIMRFDPTAKVLVASGYTMDDKVKESMEAGAVGFLGKPYQLKNFLSTVRTVLGQDEAGNRNNR